MGNRLHRSPDRMHFELYICVVSLKASGMTQNNTLLAEVGRANENRFESPIMPHHCDVFVTSSGGSSVNPRSFAIFFAMSVLSYEPENSSWPGPTA